MIKNIALLGSTGSIGQNTLEIVRKYPNRLKIKALTAGNNWQLLAEQALEFNPEYVALASTKNEADLKTALANTNIKVGTGENALIEAVSLNNVDTVLAAIVGFAGLKPVMEAIALKRRICLANKETLVVAGSIFMKAVKENKVDLLPVDSEHSAIFQCLSGLNNPNLSKIVITASGGPFKDFPTEKLKDVTVEMALKHPNWNMGGKITIDSATLMNKGLEVIEAHWLFGADYEDIDIVIHPQSLIHSLIEYSDGSVIAQLGWPDMKLPIQCALSWPERWEPPLKPFNLLHAKSMTFFEPRFEDFPSLKLAIKAGKEGGIMPCVLNAANEVAVEAFLNNIITFIEMPQLIETTLRGFNNADVKSIDQLIEIDYKARIFAKSMIKAEKKSAV
ncbi:MAG: 1-deoxy-D-xylulose-5-phosphate reductoisomerase [Candidatus Riflebacteria bacterium]|nr:1-deoxy-D-xylulose-5-phosphate reductoisomerase [Candidatus Riflebacteria bacterium]